METQRSSSTTHAEIIETEEAALVKRRLANVQLILRDSDVSASCMDLVIRSLDEYLLVTSFRRMKLQEAKERAERQLGNQVVPPPPIPPPKKE